MQNFRLQSCPLTFSVPTCSVPVSVWNSFYFATIYAMPKTLYELGKGALEEFQSEFFEGEVSTDDDKAADRIHEIADSRIPIYTYEVLEVTMSDLWVVCYIPEIYC